MKRCMPCGPSRFSVVLFSFFWNPKDSVRFGNFDKAIRSLRVVGVMVWMVKVGKNVEFPVDLI